MEILVLYFFIKNLHLRDGDFNELDDYGVPFCERQYTHGSCYISFFKFKSFDQSDPPESPQILGINSAVVIQKQTYFFKVMNEKSLQNSDLHLCTVRRGALGQHSSL